jgi:hypothetical protein
VNGFGVGKELGELFERIRQRDRADADEEERVRSVFSRITFGPALEPYIARLSVRLGPGEGPWAMFFLVASLPPRTPARRRARYGDRSPVRNPEAHRRAVLRGREVILATALIAISLVALAWSARNLWRLWRNREPDCDWAHCAAPRALYCRSYCLWHCDRLHFGVCATKGT